LKKFRLDFFANPYSEPEPISLSSAALVTAARSVHFSHIVILTRWQVKNKQTWRTSKRQPCHSERTWANANASRRTPTPSTALWGTSHMWG